MGKVLYSIDRITKRKKIDRWSSAHFFKAGGDSIKSSCGSMQFACWQNFLNLAQPCSSFPNSRSTEFLLGSSFCTPILHPSQLFTFFQMSTFLLFSSFLFLVFSGYLKILGNVFLIISIHLPTPTRSTHPTLCLFFSFLLFVVAAAFANPLSVRHHILDS